MYLPTLLVLAACLRAQERPPASAPVAAVRIYHDELHVPHVFAAADAGVFRGLGYQQALDFPVATLANLWSATGRFAEVAGAQVLSRDERMRQWGFDRRAHELATDPAQLDPDVRAWLQAYVDGVNAGRRRWLEEPGLLELLSGEQGELGFDPVPPWLHPQRTRDDPRKRLRRLFEAEVGLEHVLALGLALAAGPDFGGGGYQTRTNVWLMRGDERDPHVRMLADVHQPLQEFGYRSYFVQLAGPRYDLVGYGSPGFPCIVMGASRTLAFASMTLPKKPRELAAADIPFRIDERAQVAGTTWKAKLEADAPARLLRGEETLALVERSVTLRWWDAERGALADDPRGAIGLRWVHDGDLDFPVTEPGPAEPLAPGAEIRFEGRTFQRQRSLWESWMHLGLCERTGGEVGGVDRALEREWLTTGRGQMLLFADVQGGFEHLWSTRTPRMAGGVLERAAQALDGNDPDQLWLGDVLRGPEGSRSPGGGKSPRAWIQCNSSPHFLDGRAGEIPGVGAWKTLRQDRARELYERAAADGVLRTGELERMALDVQDQWSRANWPWIRALAGDEQTPLSARARRFVEWLELFRDEGPDGKPGAEEFLAHPLSQVMPFLVLARDSYEDELVSARAPADAIALAFDPCSAAPAPGEFLASERFEANRRALRAALEWTAELREETLAGEPGGLVNAAFFERLAGLWEPGGTLFPDAWSDPLYRRQAEEWGSPAPPLALRWGQVNVYALTPHRWTVDPAPTNARLVDQWLRSVVAPGTMEPALPFYRGPAVVAPVGGTHDSLFQVHREGFLSYAKALLPRGEGWLAFAPVDFGSQALFLAELRAGERPRVRVLPALAATEITVELPALGLGPFAPYQPTARFLRGEWSELATDESVLRATDSVRCVVLGE